MFKNREDGCFEVSISRRDFYRMHFPSSFVTCQHLRWNPEMLEGATNEERSWYKAEEMQDAVEIGATS